MKKVLLLISILSVCLVFTKGVFAQADSKLGSVAVNTDVADSSAAVGDILAISDKGLVKSGSEYDEKVYGVIVDAPILSVEPKTGDTKAVLTSGEAQVKVTNSNGAIALGDFITTSANAGVGQKATKSGYVLGKALASYDKSEVAQIPVSLEIGFVGLGDGATDGKSLVQSIVSDPGKLRMFLSVILALLVLVGGIIGFIRVVNTGVGAIGRNPLARATIIRGMIISGSTVLVIMLLGFGVSIAIIILGNR